MAEYFGKDEGIDELDSEVMTFSSDSFSFFGFEGFESVRGKTLASFGAIK